AQQVVEDGSRPMRDGGQRGGQVGGAVERFAGRVTAVNFTGAVAGGHAPIRAVRLEAGGCGSAAVLVRLCREGGLLMKIKAARLAPSLQIQEIKTVLEHEQSQVGADE